MEELEFALLQLQRLAQRLPDRDAMERGVAALRFLQPALDANDQRVKAATYPWPTSLPNLS